MYEDKTYSSLLQDALSDVGGGGQTGEGYLVYNALSALAYELEKLYIQMDYITRQGHADTADLEELIEIAKDRGIYQKKASNAASAPGTNNNRFHNFHQRDTDIDSLESALISNNS